MKHVGKALIVAALVMTIVAIWTPYHWESGLTAVVSLIAGAAILGQGDPK